MLFYKKYYLFYHINVYYYINYLIKAINNFFNETKYLYLLSI